MMNNKTIALIMRGSFVGLVALTAWVITLF
jgi:hypothetical protein